MVILIQTSLRLVSDRKKEDNFDPDAATSSGVLGDYGDFVGKNAYIQFVVSMGSYGFSR